MPKNLYHCTKCGYFFRDRKGLYKEDLKGQQQKVISIVCARCKKGV